MATSVPMRKVALPALALLVLLAVWWAVRDEGGPSADRAGVDAGARSAAEAFDRVKERLNSFSFAPLPEATGSLEIRGTVLGPDGPIEGAAVTATQPVQGETLSTLECHCGSDCKRRLLECGCPEAAAQLVELVAERRGEAPPVARATTDASGHYALRGLEPGSYTLWADAKIGVAARESVQAGDGAADLHVSRGRIISGVVKGDDRQPIAGAVVTAIHARHGRFFDAVTGPDGRFSIGPLPSGKLQVVASARDLLPNNAAVDDDPKELSLVLHVPRRIQGHVARAGQPVAGARVALDGEHRKVQVQSEKDGAFAFERLGPGDYELSASEGSDQASVTAHVTPGKEPDPVQLSLGPGCALSGHVKAEDGETVAGAKLTIAIRSRTSAAERTLTTDGAGDFSARDLPPGSARVDVRAPGFMPLSDHRATLSPGAPARLDLSLQRALRIAGVVTGSDGRPVAEVTVQAEATGDTASKPGGAGSYDGTRTGPAGRFELDVSVPGDYALTASHEEYRTLRQTVRAPSPELALRLDPGASLEGTVVDRAGAGVPGVRVTLVPQDRRESDGPDAPETKSAGSGDDGRFTVRGLVAGRYVARAFDGKGVAGAEVEIPAPGPIQLRLDEGHALRGKVVDSNGAPVEGASVGATLDGWRASSEDVFRTFAEGRPFGHADSGAGGAFSVSALREGRYQVSAGKAGYAQLKPVTAHTDGPELTLVLQSNGRIRGRVVDDAGNPIARYRVDGTEVDDESGAFEVPIRANGRRELLFDAGPDYAQTTRAIEVTLGKDTSLGTVVLTSGGAVRGRVVDRETRAPIAGALVDVGPPVPPERFDSLELHPEQGAVLTGADGTFELPHVDSSTPLAIFASEPEYLPSGQPLAKGDSPTLALERGGAIEGRVLSSSGAPIQGDVFAMSLASGHPRTMPADSSGHFRIPGLRAGDYRLFVEEEHGSGFPPLMVHVDPGGTAEVELRDRAGGATLRVKVATAEGEGSSILVVGRVATPTDARSLRAAALSGIQPSKSEGFEEFTNLPPGPYTLLYAAESHQGVSVASLPLEITSGSRELSLQVPKDAVLIKQEDLAGSFGD